MPAAIVLVVLFSGCVLSACTEPGPNSMSESTSDAQRKPGVWIETDSEVALPAGAIATVTIFESLLADTDSTVASEDHAVAQLPTGLPLPEQGSSNGLAGPAVSVQIRRLDGKLLYWNDVTVPLTAQRPVVVPVVRVD